tara:strand:+ start:462 stop:1868 length:1407 start_codon:yes stop_codon:yes gene_type:complete
MATTITSQPKASMLCSTLIPISFTVQDTGATTTNIIAECYVVDQTTAVQTQLGGRFRMAPMLNVSQSYQFDASEIFNSKTKSLLSDFNSLGTNGGAPATYFNWQDKASFFVGIRFYREYIDAAGLIVVDPSYTQSNYFYVFEGVPNVEWLHQAVSDNGQNRGAFYYFDSTYRAGVQWIRWFTNYPIKMLAGGVRESYVTIHQDEQYMLMFLAPRSAYTGCDYQIEFLTYSNDPSLPSPLGGHQVPLTYDDNVQSICCGFRDLIHGFTAGGNEGANFANVDYYTVNMLTNITNTGFCNYLEYNTRYVFKVDRSCKKNSGYLRFAFKNMVGGYDLVSSNGKYTRKVKNKFEDFEKTLGYYGWNTYKEFGKSNWNNTQIEQYVVRTELMRKDRAEHFAEMMSSTQVYLRVKQTADLLVQDPELAEPIGEQPYTFVPIVIKGGSTSFDESADNYVSIKFTFEKAVNQRTPRY